MKSKLTAIILLILFLVVAFKFYFLQDYVDTLEIEMKKKDKMILNSAKVDSVFIDKTKDYVKTIKEYKNTVSFSRGGKEVSSSDLVKEFNDLIQRNRNLVDSVNKCRTEKKIQIDDLKKTLKPEIYKHLDSINNLNWVISVLQKKYGFKYTITKNDKNLTIITQTSKLDSALILFPYYKHTLSSNDKNWVIETDKTYRKNQRKKENK